MHHLHNLLVVLLAELLCAGALVSTALVVRDWVAHLGVVLLRFLVSIELLLLELSMALSEVLGDVSIISGVFLDTNWRRAFSFLAHSLLLLLDVLVLQSEQVAPLLEAPLAQVRIGSLG